MPSATLALAAPAVPDPHDAPAIRWGILAPGGIAAVFAEAVARHTASRIVAVGSRDADRAGAFAAEHGIERAHGSYAALVADPEVEAIYVASPHSAHHEHALLALHAGKPVLIEKAFARNLRETDEILAAADAGGLLAVEAMWSRYLPHYDVVARTITAGTLGEVVLVTGDHGQLLWPNGPARLAEPELAGGALLDLGVYPLHFADVVLGGLDAVTGAGTLTELGVDATNLVTAHGPAGGVASLRSTMAAASACRGTVVGTAARLELDGVFYDPTTVRLVTPDGVEVDRFTPTDTSKPLGFAYQAAEFARLLGQGRTDGVSVPRAATRRVMAAMDKVRADLGVRYPGE